jgi:hypothetical protein
MLAEALLERETLEAEDIEALVEVEETAPEALPV